MKSENSEFWKQCFLRAIDLFREGKVRVYDKEGEPIYNDIFAYCTEFANTCVKCLEPDLKTYGDHWTEVEQSGGDVIKYFPPYDSGLK